MAANGLVVSVDMDKSVMDMFDIVQELCEIVEMVPSWQREEAEINKQNIVDRMVAWLDYNGKEQHN